MKRGMIFGIGVLSLVGVVMAHASLVWAQSAEVTHLAGLVEIKMGTDIAFGRLEGTKPAASDTRVRTGAGGLARVHYANGTEMTVRSGSDVVLGGTATQSAQVRLGQVLIRARKLLTSEGDQTFRTPIAVAAIRGTEFGISVEPNGESSVYVFEGKVAVSNAQIPDRDVLVGAGQMTVVRILQPPTAPAPFQSQEFDRMGRLDALERGEDPVLEASEEPASESYLAFADPDIDALRNPAYMAESRGKRSTSVVSAHGLKSGESFTTGTVKGDASRFSGYGSAGQNVTLLQTNSNGWIGFDVRGDASHEEGTVVTRTPFTLSPIQSQQITKTRLGKVGMMAAQKFGSVSLGLGGAYRKSHIDVDDLPASGGPSVLTATRNRLFALQGGLVINPGSDHTLGIGVTHQFLKNTTDAGTLRLAFTGYNHYWEALYRHPIGGQSFGHLIRVEHTKTSEDVSDVGALIYHENRSVWALKGGSGIGIMPTKTMVFGADLVGGFSRETATQYLPSGEVREDENDLRFSGTLHLGAQLYLSKIVLFTFDVTHQVLWQDMDFLLLPGSAQQREDKTITTQFNTSAVTGIGLVRDQFVVEYFISIGGTPGRPLVHNILLVLDL